MKLKVPEVAVKVGADLFMKVPERVFKVGVHFMRGKNNNYGLHWLERICVTLRRALRH